jgi:hypothetical protein
VFIKAAAFALVTAMPASAGEYLYCWGFSAERADLLDFKTYRDDEYFTVDETAFEFYNEEDGIYLYGKLNTEEDTYYGILYDNTIAQFMLISMSIEDLLTQDFERVTLYAIGNCFLDDSI